MVYLVSCHHSHMIVGFWLRKGVRYFLFHATLIPVHCLRQNPLHWLAPDWRSQIRSSLAIMDAMGEVNPNSSKCREISLKLCWPHLEEEGIPLYCSSTAFPSGMADSETASVVSGYDMWCKLMSNPSTGAPIYQWADSNDQTLSFFL